MNQKHCILISVAYILLSIRVINARKKSKRHEVLSNEVISNWEDLATSLDEGHKSIHKTSPNYKEIRKERQQNSLQETPDVKDMNKLFEMIQNMSLDIVNLKTTIANIKYQNHMIYKQLKKTNTKCPAKTDKKKKRNVDQDIEDKKKKRKVDQEIEGLQMTEPAARCPYGFIWSEELAKCLQFNGDRVSWRMAKERCLAKDAQLVTIPDEKTMSYIKHFDHKNRDLKQCDFWIGANDEKAENDWRWIANGDPITYSNWRPNEPNNGGGKNKGEGNEHCAMMLWVFSWAWNDASCKNENACYICEYQ